MDIQKLKLMGVTADSKITQPNTAKDVSFRGEMGRKALGDGSVGRSLIKKYADQLTPPHAEIEVQFKDRVTEKEKDINSIELIIDRIIDKKMGDSTSEEVPSFKNKIDIFNAIVQENPNELSEDEFKTIFNYLQKNSAGYADSTIESYDTAERRTYALDSTSSVLKTEANTFLVEITENDIVALKNSYDVTEQDLPSKNIHKKLESYAKKFSHDEYSLITQIMRSAKSKEELIQFMEFDFSEFARRDLSNILKKLDVSYDPNFAKEFLFCSDEEFQEKIDRLNRRPYLRKHAKEAYYSKNLGSFSAWKTLLALPDSEYERVLTPLQNRNEIKISKAEYKKAIKEKLETPFEYDISKALETTQQNHFFAQCFRDFRNLPSPETLYQFEEIAPIKKDNPPPLPTTGDAFNELFKNKKFALEIKDMGGMNPTTESSEIKETDNERLGVVENAGIKIRYGAKTNWSNAKIARDIMQNFYDGNGHTLEGVKIEIEEENDGSYKIKIIGNGSYSYERLDSLGNSSKDGDSSNAGAFGEGTRIVAVNLLARPDTPYVKYACGDWAMTFGKSSEDVQTANMTQQLDKNEEPVKGNYIELKTANLDLVNEILKSKDYFYSPYNKDFQDLNYENEFVGIKTLKPKEKGNIYVVQRYETLNGIEDSLDGVSLVFKKMPNDPELVEKNFGKGFDLGTGRDRICLTNYQIKSLMRRYAKTIPDKELLSLIANLKEEWTLGNKLPGPATMALIEEATRRKIGFSIPQDPQNAEERELAQYRATSERPTESEIDMLINEGYIPVRYEMGALGIIRNGSENQEKLHTTPTPEETEKIRLVDEGVRVLADNLEIETFDKLTKEDAAAPTLILSSFGLNNIVAEAIINSDSDQFDGQWVQKSCFAFDNFAKMLTTKLHEITHKYGGDTSVIFTKKMIELQNAIMKGLVLNPTSLDKLKVLESIFDNTDAYLKDKKFDINRFKQDIEKLLSESSSVDTSGMSFIERAILKIKDLFNIETTGENASKQNKTEEVYEIPKFTPKATTAHARTLPTLGEALTTLYDTGSIAITIPDKGGKKPTLKERAEIKPEDVKKLGKTKSARIKLRYGAKTNWSEFKIARDIMQNFFDGNGHTLEGVNIEVAKQENGKFKVKITGDGMYDYSHLEAIGDSTKDDDSNNAGAFGEGTRLVAVNMLANHGVDHVTYGCGDWKMTFGKSSDDISSADMTQRLDQNETPVKGNYIEFETANDKLVAEILKSENSFYHPENPDFKDLIYENEFFGVKLLEDENQKGNIYIVQRYETENPYEDLNGISFIFKTSPNNPNIEKASGRICPLETGRDRVALHGPQLESLSYHYASTMNDDDLIKLLGSLGKYYQKDRKNVHEFMQDKTKRPIEESFATGIMDLLYHRDVTLNGENLKLAAVDHYFSPYDEKFNYLASKGYKFVPTEMKYIGIRDVETAYNDEHSAQALKPTKTESKKIKLLSEAMKLFQDEDKKAILPKDIGDIKIFNAKECDLPNAHAEEAKENSIKALYVDRNFLRNKDFITVLTALLSESQREKGTDESSSFSYALTTLIESELTTLLHNPEIAQKLQVLSKMYDRIK